MTGPRKNFPVLTDYPRTPVMVGQSQYKLTLTCTADIDRPSREMVAWRWIMNDTVDLGLLMDDDDRSTARIAMPYPGCKII